MRNEKKAYALYSEILETETPQNEKLVKIGTQKLNHSTVYQFFVVSLCRWSQIRQ